MQTLVTGGTGFVGAHVVRVLLDAEFTVRCLVRTHSDLSSLEGLPVELVIGDLRDAESLDVAVAGCEALFHCAADYRLGAPDPDELYASNVEGTRVLLEAARRAEVRRVVYTSSVGALGREADGSPATEQTPVSLQDMIGHYKRSKYLAERVAEGYAESGLELVIVNPSTPIGELDRKPTPTGQILLDYLRGRLPAYVTTGLNVIDVRDVAAGHLAAFEKGRSGERYILGNQNMTLKELLDLLSEVTGLPPVRWHLPHVIPHAAATMSEAWARLSGRPAAVSLESVRMARNVMFFDASKAVAELDLPQTPVRGAVERAVDDFLQSGSVAGRRAEIARRRRQSAQTLEGR